jgi:hypothetical protein
VRWFYEKVDFFGFVRLLAFFAYGLRGRRECA